MIDNLLGFLDTMVFAQVKSPILHNTRDGSEFHVRSICHFRGRTSALGRVGGGKRGIPGRHHTCLL